MVIHFIEYVKYDPDLLFPVGCHSILNKSYWNSCRADHPQRTVFMAVDAGSCTFTGKSNNFLLYLYYIPIQYYMELDVSRR
ncbi:hypothetical protein FHK02_1114 [Spirosoma sp. LMG 31448]|uniref:Uncharacterized protein n=1 Tax=Spirosoma utsteinense TaxID=2585773 RepID=A0ABR6W0B3_9BACT|nr:hypothetical protein [Spirosoma utsteinense]MBC3789568.1 hypothetical protein [Spirosoma utsteinense]